MASLRVNTQPGPCSSIYQPAVAQGNVGELALDVLITSLQPALVGYLEDDSVLPCVGNDPFHMANPGMLTTTIELFKVTSLAGARFCLPETVPVGESRVFAGNVQSNAPRPRLRCTNQVQSVSQLAFITLMDP